MESCHEWYLTWIYFYGDLRTDTGISITYSKNKPGYKIDVFMSDVVCFTPWYHFMFICKSNTGKLFFKKSTHPTLFENFIVLQYNNFFCLIKPYHTSIPISPYKMYTSIHKSFVYYQWVLSQEIAAQWCDYFGVLVKLWRFIGYSTAIQYKRVMHTVMGSERWDCHS